MVIAIFISTILFMIVFVLSGEYEGGVQIFFWPIMAFLFGTLITWIVVYPLHVLIKKLARTRNSMIKVVIFSGIVFIVMGGFIFIMTPSHLERIEEKLYAIFMLSIPAIGSYIGVLRTDENMASMKT